MLFALNCYILLPVIKNESCLNKKNELTMKIMRPPTNKLIAINRFNDVWVKRVRGVGVRR